MTNCPDPVGTFENNDGEKFNVACKKWSCEVCRKVLKNKLLDRIRDGFIKYREKHPNCGLYFLTLTLSNVVDDSNIMKYWARLRAHISKYGIRNLAYVWCKEFTQAGIRHLHIIYAYDEDIDQNFLSESWKKVTENTSCVVDIRAIDSIRSASGYISKYITKSLDALGFKKGEHRFGFSVHDEFKPEPWASKDECTFHYGDHVIEDYERGMIKDMMDHAKKARQRVKSIKKRMFMFPKFKIELNYKLFEFMDGFKASDYSDWLRGEK